MRCGTKVTELQHQLRLVNLKTCKLSPSLSCQRYYKCRTECRHRKYQRFGRRGLPHLKTFLFCNITALFWNNLRNNISIRFFPYLVYIIQHRFIAQYTLQIFHSSRPPKISIGLYHYPWLIFPIALHFFSLLALFCCTVHYCLFLAF